MVREILSCGGEVEEPAFLGMVHFTIRMLLSLALPKAQQKKLTSIISEYYVKKYNLPKNNFPVPSLSDTFMKR